MKLILKRSGAVIKGANKLVFLSLLFFCFTSHAQAQCSITPNNATTCFASGVFNFSYTTTGNPDQYTLATGLRSMPGFSPITDAITSLNTIFIPTSAVPGVYDFTIVVTNTTTPCTSIAATFTLTIFAPPTLGVTAGIGPVCVGSNIVLTAAPSNLVTYTWVSTPGSTIPAVFDPAVTVNEITTYTVTGTDANGCFASASATLTPLVNVGITSATAGASPICPDATTVLTANGVTGTNAIVTWWTGTNGTGTNLGSTTTITAGPGTYYARVTGDCGGPIEASVTIASYIKVAITSATADAVALCPGATTTLTANGVAGTKAIVNWHTAQGGTGTSLGTGLTLTGQGPGIYYAWVTGDCGGPVEASVIITEKTIAAITSVTSDVASLCPGAKATLTANGVAGTNAIVIWHTSQGGTGTSLGTGLTLTGQGPGIYYAWVTGDCGTPVEASVTITAKTIAAITSVTSDAVSLCPGVTATLTANGVAGSNAIVKWYTAPGGTGTSIGTGLILAGRGEGTYYARVTGDCGTPVEASVTIAAKVNVAITSVTTNIVALCPGTTATLTAHGVAGTNAIVNWYTAPGGTGTSIGTGLTLAGQGAGTYYARVTGDCGTPLESSVTVSEKVIVAITSVTADAVALCPGTSAILTANGVTGTSPIVKWYSTPGGIGFLLGTGLTLTTNRAGTYYAQVTGDCGTPVEASVTITAKTIAAITSVTSDAASLCPGTTATLTANGVAGSNSIVNWYTNPGGTGTLLGTGLLLSGQSAGTYYARVTGDCGTPVEASVTVAAKVIVSITSATADVASVCPGATATLNANGVAGTNATVNWFTTSGGTGTTLGTGLTLAGRGAGTYYARVTGDCGTPVEASVTVSEKVIVVITSVTSDAVTLCPGTTTTLTANGVAGTNAIVNWYASSGGTGTLLGTGLTLTGRGPGTYFARVTGDCGTPVEASVTVSAKTILAITSATSDAASLCPGTTATLTANGVAGSNSIVNWYTNTGGTGTLLGSGLLLTGQSAGTYYARVTGDCGTPVEASVTVAAKVMVSITSATADVASVCPGTTATLTANGVTGTNAIVIWYMTSGGTGVSLGTGLTLAGRGAGTYFARVTGDCGTPVEASVTISAKTIAAITSVTPDAVALCPGTTTTLTANGVVGTNAIVNWYTRSGGTGTSLGTGLTLTGRGPGTYFARVKGDCGPAAEASVTVGIKTIVSITTATAMANAICPGVTTTLTANGVTGTNALVTWWTATGGTGTNLGTGMTLPYPGPGTYYARVTGDCGSAVEASVTITSKANVGITSATALVNSLCPGNTTDLTANGVTGNNAITTWWSEKGGTGTNLGTGLTLANQGAGTYYARVTGDCGSAVEANVTIVEKINASIISATATASPICSFAITTLTANGVAGTNAVVTWWTGTGGTGTKLGEGLTINNKGPGTYYARVTGECGSPAEAVVTVATDNSNPVITCPVAINTFSDPGKCTASGINLGIPVTSDNCSVASVTNNAPAIFPLGNTVVTWTVTNGSGNKATCTQIVNVTGLVDAINDAGSVNELTGGTAVADILANDLKNCAVASSAEVTTSFISSTNPAIALNGRSVIVAPNTLPGVYTLTYQVCDNANPTKCAQADAVVTVIRVNQPPVVSDITKTVDENQPLLFTDIDFTSKFADSNNDKLVKVKIISLPLNGKLKLSNTDMTADQEIISADLAKLTFIPDKDYSGEISFAWKASDSGDYSVLPANVYITITPSLFFIPEGFSPNGDGVNDYFIIKGAENYTVNLKVFNRWGNLVYSSKHYLNDWDGVSNNGMLISNQLPAGTYFYILNFNNGDKEKIGYLTLNK